jgi:hypothetical protein
VKNQVRTIPKGLLNFKKIPWTITRDFFKLKKGKKIGIGSSFEKLELDNIGVDI